MTESIRESSESIFYKAFNSSINIIMAITTIEKGVYVDVNGAFLQTTGYSRHEVIGRSSTELGIVSVETRGRMKKLLLENGKVENFDVEFLTKANNLRTLTLFAEIITVDGEQKLFTIAHDLTELNAAKSELENEKSLLLAIFKSTSGAFVLKNLDSLYQKVNPTFCSFFGITENRSVGKTDFDFFPESEAIKFRAEDLEIIKSGQTKEYDRKFEGENGSVWCQTIKTPVRDSGGAISGVLCSVTDITKRKLFEELLNARFNISYYSLYSSMPDLFQKIIRELERLTESRVSFFYSVDEIAETVSLNSCSGVTSDPDGCDYSCRLVHAGAWADCIRFRQPFVFNDYKNFEGKKDQPAVHDHINRCMVVPVFEGRRIVAVFGLGNKAVDYKQSDVEIVTELGNMAWDIISRKRAVDILKESQRKLQTLLNNLPGMAFRRKNDRNWTLEYISDGCFDLTGYTSEELVSNRIISFGDLIHPDDRIRIWEETQAFLKSNRNYEVEYRIIHRDSSVKWVWAKGSGVWSEDGQPVAVEGFIADITEHRRKDSELKRLASAIHHVAETIVITDEKGIIKYANPSFEKTTGYKCSESIGKKTSILKSGEHDDSFYSEVWQTITSGKTWNGRFINRKKDDSLYTEEASITPVIDESGKISEFVAVKRDITKELNLEARLFQSQKMEAIGSLAGGIAHDFNNILFPLIGFSEILQQDLPESSHLQDYVSEILTASLRAKELVKQILAFSRQSKQEKTILRIQNVLNEVIRFSRATLPSTITVKTSIENSCRPVLADPTQIHQVAMNLVTNALHAMEETGGILSIVLDEVVFDTESALNFSLKPGLHIRLTVSDTGCGIDPAIMDRIFDPYFTTKEKDKGTGIGLAVVHGIVKSIGGCIELNSSPGEGASFIIYLPCFMEDRKEMKKDSEFPVPCGNEKILVVDDEEAIARMVRQMLERLGYSVSVRTGSDEALQLFKDDPYRFDLIITDMTMPKMTGDKLSAEIKRIRREIPIIICTGFSEKMDGEKASMLGIDGFVLKPVLQTELGAKVRGVLDKARK